MSSANQTHKHKRKASNLANPVANAANVANVANVATVANAYPPYFILKTRTRTVDKDGKEILFKLRKGQNLTEIYEFFKGTIISNDGIKLADDGIYTWILIASKEDKYGDLYVAKTISMQEIGTLHRNLYDTMTKLKPVVMAAGEFEKKGTKITFNLLSGTFMEPKVRGKTNKNRNNIMQIATQHIIEKFKDYNLNVKQTTNKILSPAKIITLPNNIARYNQLFNRANENNENNEKPPKRAKAKSVKAKSKNAANA